MRLFRQLGLCYALSVSLLAAQITQEKNPPAPTITVQAQLVVLDVVVTDTKGKFISGLNRNDFVVYENGIPQVIKTFTSPADHPDVPDTPNKDRNGHDDWHGSPLTMIVVDEMDTPFSEMAYARICVKRYLQAQPTNLVEPTILLWLNDRGVHPLTTFTRDRDVLLSALAKQPASLNDKMQRGAAVEQLSSAFSALQQIALSVRGTSGKKEIVWIGRSSPAISPVDLDWKAKDLLERAVRSTIDTLLASRVSLYIIDPSASGSDTSDVATNGINLGPPAAGAAHDPFEDSFNLNMFVTQTGGTYFYGHNDLDHQISDSIERGTHYYTLSYAPTRHDFKGDYKSIVVRTKNPSFVVTTRQGYYSGVDTAQVPTKDSVKQDEQNLRFDLYEAIVTGMQYTGLGMHVRDCERYKDGRTMCDVLVDTGSLAFTPSGDGGEQSKVIAVLSALDNKGRLLNYTADEVTVKIPAEQMSRIQAGYTVIQVEDSLPKGSQTVRAVLRDSTGRIGTADVSNSIVEHLTGSTNPRKIRTGHTSRS